MKQNQDYSRLEYRTRIRRRAKEVPRRQAYPELAKALMFRGVSPFIKLFWLEEVMNSVRRIEGIRKVAQISFVVYWRHYG